jgi:ATP-dependent DNA ligase
MTRCIGFPEAGKIAFTFDRRAGGGIVCQVSFAEWRRGNQLRHTSFKGMRGTKTRRRLCGKRRRSGWR